MDFLHTFIDTFLHLDKYLANWISEYGMLIYLFLFLIIFVETGVVIWPWLPGDSLLFVAGTFAAIGSLNVFFLILVCVIAAILGNTSNYLIGKYFGAKALGLKFRGKPLVKKEHLDRTHNFYEKYGPVTMIITRFIPIIRTISPFVAGVGKMTYTKFTFYNIAGALLWVPSFVLLGFALGENPWVKAHFELLAVGIIIVSVLPIFIALIKRKLSKTTT
ncbi:MAG: VTT domain-containing protein [Chitinophagales bacterium]